MKIFFCCNNIYWCNVKCNTYTCIEVEVAEGADVLTGVASRVVYFRVDRFFILPK